MFKINNQPQNYKARDAVQLLSYFCVFRVMFGTYNFGITVEVFFVVSKRKNSTVRDNEIAFFYQRRH